MTRYAWMLQQVPVIIAHLRDSMLPLAATDYNRARVDGTREQPLPFRVEPMLDADTLWAVLTAYGNTIARHIYPAPHALTARLRASQDWHEAGDAAYTITAWLVANEERIAGLDTDMDAEAGALFLEIGRLLGKYRIHPARLRTSPTRCVVCGEYAVRAEWALNRDGDVARTVQCTVCLRRYDPEEVRNAADLQRSREAGSTAREDDQTLATAGHAHGV